MTLLLSHSVQVLDFIYTTRSDFGAICGDRPDYLANRSPRKVRCATRRCTRSLAATGHPSRY